MWSRRLLVFFAGCLAGLFDATVAGWLPGPLLAVRAALPFIVLLAAFSSLERTLTAAVAAGIVIDAIQPSFGLMTLRLLITGAVIRAVAERYVTNRSLAGSLALGVFGLLCDRVLLGAFTFLRGLSSVPFIPEVRLPFIAQGVWVLVVMTATFFLFAAFTRRFMPLLSRR